MIKKSNYNFNTHQNYGYFFEKKEVDALKVWLDFKFWKILGKSIQFFWDFSKLTREISLVCPFYVSVNVMKW